MKKLAIIAIILIILLCGCNVCREGNEMTKIAEKYDLMTRLVEPYNRLAIEISEQSDPIQNEELVKIIDYIPSIQIDLRYAAADNFTNHVIYEFTDGYLRYGTILKLQKVQAELMDLGYSLVVWDAFRPVSAQFRLWEIMPNSNYVANPNTGYSTHSRGNTVDVSMVALNGEFCEMPTEFDDFSAKADRNYSDIPEQAVYHASLLERIMEKHGFEGYAKEWWHYSDTMVYDVEKSFNP